MTPCTLFTAEGLAMLPYLDAIARGESGAEPFVVQLAIAAKGAWKIRQEAMTVATINSRAFDALIAELRDNGEELPEDRFGLTEATESPDSIESPESKS